MSTINVIKKNHAYLHVDCEDRGILNELTEYFSFFVPGYKWMPDYKNKIWDGKIRLYNNRTKELYVGLFPYLQKFAESEGREYPLEVHESEVYGLPHGFSRVDISFLNDYIITHKNEIIEPRDYQLDAVEYALSAKRAVLLSPTASGKSLIIYLLLRWYLENNDGRILIIVPTTSLVNQMFTDFADYSESDPNFNVDDICHMIYSGREKDTDKRVVISTWQSLYKLPKQYFSSFGCVMGDECHLFKAKSLSSIMTKLVNAEYRFGTTGSLDDTQTHRLVLEGLFGIVKRVTHTKDLMDRGDLAKLNIKMLLLKYPDEIRKVINKSKYHDEVDYIVQSQKRNKFITNLALDQDGNTLILFQFVEKHGKPLYDLIKSRAHKDRKIFFVSGATDVDTREQVRHITEKEKNAIIVASYGVFSTGINIKNIHKIIFSSPSKSQIRVLQSIGRGLRKSDDGRDTILYDIGDDLSWGKNKNHTLNHAAERIKIYSKERFTYQIFEVPLS